MQETHENPPVKVEKAVDNTVALEVKKSPLPDNWTYLVHGSNLAKLGWSGDKAHQLDQDTLVVQGLGLSVVDQQEVDREQASLAELRSTGVMVGSYNTTQNYSDGEGVALEIRVIFPAFHSRRALADEQRAALVKKYGMPRFQDVVKLANTVHWNNYKEARHPLLPSGMRLIKLTDDTTDNRRVIEYLPEELMDVYQLETMATIP